MARSFATTLGFILLSAVFAADAQPVKAHRIGYLSSLSPSGGRPHFAAFRQGLRELGYVEGRNIAIEARWAEGDYERLPALAKELVALEVGLIVSAGGPPAARAAKSATTSIPVVFISGSALAAGIVPNLGRPGGNVTGLEVFAEELDTKRLELFKEALPRSARIAVLWNPGNLKRGRQRQELETAAQAQGTQLRFVEASRPDEIEPAFALIAREADAVLVSADPMFTSEYRQIVELAARTRLPAMYPFRGDAEAGGLMSYGTDLYAVYRSAAIYIDKILTGTKPGNLPVQQPTRFELVINLKTAKALGLAIPAELMLRADHVIR